MNRTNSNNDTDLFLAWELWAVVRRLNQVRYPNPLDTLHAVFGNAPPARLPSDRELGLRGVDLYVLDYELGKGMDPELWTRALRLGVIDVESFNNGAPRNRENRREYYEALATVVDRVETRRRQTIARNRRLARQRQRDERAAMNRSLVLFGEAL